MSASVAGRKTEDPRITRRLTTTREERRAGGRLSSGWIESEQRSERWFDDEGWTRDGVDDEGEDGVCLQGEVSEVCEEETA